MNLTLSTSDIMGIVRDAHQSVKFSISILRSEDIDRKEALKHLDYVDTLLKTLETFTEEIK